MILRDIIESISKFEESIDCEEHELIFVNSVPLKLFRVAKGGFSDFNAFGNKMINESETEHNIEAFILKNDALNELELLHKLFVDWLNRIKFPLYSYLNNLAYPDTDNFGLIDFDLTVNEDQAQEIINWIEHFQIDLFISDKITEVLNSHMSGKYSTEIELEIESHTPIIFRSKFFVPTLNQVITPIIEITETARRKNYIYLKSLAAINYLDFNSIVNQIGKIAPRSIVIEFLSDKKYGGELAKQVLTCYYLINNFDISTEKFIKIITRADKNYPYIELELDVSSRAIHTWLAEFRKFYNKIFLKDV